MKKKITAVSLLVLLIAMLALGTVANFTAEGRATNVISTNAIDLAINEDHEGNAARTASSGVYALPTLMPSQSVKQAVTIHNAKSEPFYTRVKVEIDIRDSSGQAMDDSLDQHVGLNFQTTDWLEQDGWYYYKEAVAGGADSLPIFDTVLLKPTTPNEMMDARVSIVVTAQAVQSKNNDIPAGGITQVAGWPAES